MRLKLISCPIFEPEVHAAVARSTNRVDLHLIEDSPHRAGDEQRVAVFQALIQQTDRSRYHAVLLLAGSCKRGLTGLQAGAVPLVLPRAKDCISLVLDPLPGAPSRPAPPVAPWTRPPAHRLAPRSSGSTTVWMAPVKAPELSPKPIAAGAGSWGWRAAFNPKTSASNPGRAPRRLSLLDKLLQGYWNYADFLVVPPGWRVAVSDKDGTLVAQKWLL